MDLFALCLVGFNQHVGKKWKAMEKFPFWTVKEGRGKEPIKVNSKREYIISYISKRNV